MNNAKPIKPNGRNGDTQANIGYEEKLWKAADTLRGAMDAAEYKHVVLGLIFLKYVSDSYEERRQWLLRETADPKSECFVKKEAQRGYVLEDRDEYTGQNVFWVPMKARWQEVQKSAKKPEIGQLIDDAMDLIERENPVLKGVLPKNYARPEVDKRRLGELIDLLSNIDVGGEKAREMDILGRVYEYFIGKFASAEGKSGGEFYTPSYVVNLLVHMIQPYKGRVYDPCCGSGGMFVQSEKFVEAHGGQRHDLTIYGQELNPNTWRLCKMNLAIRGIEANLGPQWGDTFHSDQHPDLKADFILANPPFNISDWGGDKLQDDKRWKYGPPSPGNANFAWVQHIIHHLAPNGKAAFILANISLTSETGGDDVIRKAILDANLVDCIVTLPDKLFYSTPIPVGIWILSRGRKNEQKILFVDASGLGHEVTRTHRELAEPDILRVARTYEAWSSGSSKYEDETGFCRSVPLQAVVSNNYALLPAAYVNEGHRRNSANVKLAATITGPARRTASASLREIAALSTSLDQQLAAVESALPFLEKTVSFEKRTLGDLLEPIDDRLGDGPEPEVLTCTESGGLVLQRERFASRVATDDASKYKMVRMGDIVYNPYLLWKGSIGQCWIVELGITSPAYEIFRIREGFDQTIIGQLVTSPAMIKRYDGISFGTIQRRRRAPPEKFLELEVNIPRHEHLTDLLSLLGIAQNCQQATRKAQRATRDFLEQLCAGLR